MRISNKNLVILILTAALFLPILIFAQSPGIPHKFYGIVTFSEGATTDGLVIEAKVEGTVVGTSATNDGKYGYLPDLLFATDSGSTNAGKTVEFYVSGIKANENETAIFVNGESTELNLMVSGTIGTIEETDETKIITDETMAIAPDQSANVKLGDNLLNITISSAVSTNAEITKIEKLESDFFTGTTAIIAGNNLLNAFEIDITGDDLTISVTITYDDTNIDEDSIKPYKFSGTSWVVISLYDLNKSANTITFEVSSAQTPYAVFGESPPPAEEPSPAPSGGGGPIAQATPTPTPTPLSEAAKNMDTNSDDKIDVLDFNGLMVNWGSTTVDNPADFDNNGTVDVFDFNLLMIYWTG